MTLPRSANDWRDTTFVNFTGVNLNRLEVRSGARGFEVTRNPANKLWELTKPMPARAVPELAAAIGTANELFPPTHNPWRRGFTPGGSSGGSAAAVAAGLCTIAFGDDMGGSIRIPAACCGVAGLRPSPGVSGCNGKCTSSTFTPCSFLSRSIRTVLR